MLHKVKKIHIGEFAGPKEDVEAFVERLAQELEECGFEVVGEKDVADGVMRGQLQIKKGIDKFGGNLLLALERMGAFALDDSDTLRAMVRMNTPAGKKLWAGNFYRSVRSVSGLDLARVRAKDVAKKLMRDYQSEKMMSSYDGSSGNGPDDDADIE